MSGIFGVVFPKKENCIQVLFRGTDYNSHMGNQHAGLTIFNQNGEWKRANHSIQDAPFKTKFNRYLTDLDYQGDLGIGVISDFDVQPLVISTRFGPIAIAFNGWVQNLHELVEKYIANGHSFILMGQDPDVRERERIYSVALLATLINEGKTLEKGIQHIWDVIQGSASMLVLTPDGIISARDRYGRTPVVIGYNEEIKSWAITSETCSFFNLKYKIIKYLDPGEIVCVSLSGVQYLCKGNCTFCKLCAFLYIYSSNPASAPVKGIEVAPVRIECGKNLAKLVQGIMADLVFGIPDSGVFHGYGFAQESGLPYIEADIKYETYGRSFISNEAIRKLVVDYKLIPIISLIIGKHLVMTDDSVVRGTQLGDLIWILLEVIKALSIHLAIACPPLLRPCPYIYSTRKRRELAARRAIRDIEGRDIEDIAVYLDPDSSQFKQMVERIKWNILTYGREDVSEEKVRELMARFSLQYQLLGDMVEAIGLPEEQLCLYCWTGEAHPSIST
ncbi:MAG: amidophosphoribosyltransferase [bacterium]